MNLSFLVASRRESTTILAGLSLDLVLVGSFGRFLSGEFSGLLLEVFVGRYVPKLGLSYVSVAYRLSCSGLTSAGGVAVEVAKASRVCFFFDLRGGILSGQNDRIGRIGRRSVVFI